jgi:AcrR family transcriptional regulator
VTAIQGLRGKRVAGTAGGGENGDTHDVRSSKLTKQMLVTSLSKQVLVRPVKERFMTADGTQRSPTASRQRNPRGQGQILREQLVAAATDLLATLDSPQALTLRMVARQVGVAPASVYGHFADLGALVEHVLRLRYEELAELMTRAAGRASTPVEDLVARCAAYLCWGTANPGHYRVVFGGRAPSDVFPSTAHEAGAELLAGVVAALAAASTPQAREVQGAAHDSHGQLRAGLLLWAGLHGIITLHNDRHNAPWPPLDELLVHLVALHTGQQPDVIAEALRVTAAGD